MQIQRKFIEDEVYGTKVSTEVYFKKFWWVCSTVLTVYLKRATMLSLIAFALNTFAHLEK